MLETSVLFFCLEYCHSGCSGLRPLSRLSEDAEPEQEAVKSPLSSEKARIEPHAGSGPSGRRKERAHEGVARW